MEICVVTKDALLARFLLLELAEAGFAAEVRDVPAENARLCLCDLDSYSGDVPENTVGFSYDENKCRRVQDFLHRPIHAEALRSMVAKRLLPDVSAGDSLTVDRATRRVKSVRGEVRLSEKELALFEHLSAVPLLTREAGASIFGEGESNIVDVYMHYLRKKLKTVCPYNVIQSKRGEGYMLSETLRIVFL